MKEKFTPDEWDCLKILPFQIFAMVAAADKKIDKDEVKQMEEEFRQSPYYKDPLHRELFVDILTTDLKALFSEATRVTNFVERAAQIKRILKEKLTSEEYQRFIVSMFISGIKIAGASGGGGFLKRTGKISEEEKRALLVFAALFELDPMSISKFLK